MKKKVASAGKNRLFPVAAAGGLSNFFYIRIEFGKSRKGKQPIYQDFVFTTNTGKIVENLFLTIKGCLENSPKHQKVLYEHFFGYCLKVVFRYVYRYDTAVDIVNDGFVKIFRSMDKFSVADPANIAPQFMGWIRTIMIHVAIDHLRKTNFLPEIGSLPDTVWALEDQSQPSDKDLLYKELILQIKKLSPAYRAVFNLYVIDGFTHQEIAAKLGISVGASKSNLSKARVILQSIIKQNDQQISYAASR